MAPSSKTIFVIGTGPGIGRSVTLQFAKQYSHIALFARRAEQLKVEKKAVQDAAGAQVKVETYEVDVTDTEALFKAYDSAEAALGKPEVVFYNAARVLPSQLVTHDVKEIEYDFKINVSALYVTAQRYIPHLTQLAQDSNAQPALIITSSALPDHPIPQVFALSLVKAAQRNLARTLAMTYENVLIGLINVQGPVSPDDATLNPPNIAAKAWGWFQQCKEKKSFEVII